MSPEPISPEPRVPNPESVRKRLEVYDAQTAPVIDYYRHQQKLTSVDGVGAMEEVFE
ncbi:MAG: hypothetical protein JSS41_06225, partial [Proteobacteria bacterium]|nr:hypothetical protein [Pseudomonadota bacterium]